MTHRQETSLERMVIASRYRDPPVSFIRIAQLIIIDNFEFCNNFAHSLIGKPNSKVAGLP